MKSRSSLKSGMVERTALDGSFVQRANSAAMASGPASKIARDLKYNQSVSAILSPLLAAVVDARSADEPVDIVLELQRVAPDGSSDRAARIARTKDRFETLSSRVGAAVARTGGNVVGQAWINSTMKATVPIRALLELCQVEGVIRIDVPSKLTREG